MAFRIYSPDFTEGSTIPRKFTCDGSDVSPSIHWESPPNSCESYTLIVNDPDAPAGNWIHWVVYNIPASTRSLSEISSSEVNFPDGMHQGRNSWHQTKYGGPCPPSGTHQYFFTLYALDSILDMEGGANYHEVMAAMQSHILAQTMCMGTYSRK